MIHVSRWAPSNPPVRGVATRLVPERERIGLPLESVENIQLGTVTYFYRGLRCLKNPFDLAILARLFYETKPGTIVEIGTSYGGGALWISDQVKAFGLDTIVYSVDIRVHRMRPEVIPGVKFLRGDVYDLEHSELRPILDEIKRPLLVIEDSVHLFQSCLCALEFFDEYLVAGEYIIIEDGVVNDLGAKAYANGPNRAVAEFLERHQGDYVIDYNLCDTFGPNFTGNPNGYLKKIVANEEGDPS
jgi:cephalosporin hydroxylase